VVHFSIILLLLGSTFGSFSGYTAQQFIPRGEIVHIQNLTKFGNISSLPQQLSFRINDFWITYTKDLKTDQFYSDISLLTNEGKELKRKTIFVNEPLLFDNLVLYQTDWDIVGIKLKISNNEIFQLPVKKITKGGRKFWFCSLPIENNSNKKVSIVINDLNGQLFVYDSKGVLIQQSNIGTTMNISDNLQIQFISFLTTTGLQIKSDPGIGTVYLSFLLLIVSIYVSFFTYSQIWVFEAAQNISLGGNSNRAVLFFQQEFRELLKRIAKVGI
jgi:cytochrome c biogenesis protein